MQRRLSQRAAFLQNGKAATLIKVRIVNGLGISHAEGIRLHQVGQYLGAERDGECPAQDCLAARRTVGKRNAARDSAGVNLIERLWCDKPGEYPVFLSLAR